MWQVGDRVVYSNQGVCDITGIQQIAQGGQTKDYLTLVPVNQPENRLYIPMHNETALSKMVPLLTEDALHQLLSSEVVRADMWEPVENKRKQIYHDLLSQGNRESLMAMVHTLYTVRSRQRALGRRLHIADELFLRDTERRLAEEISFVLGMEQDDARKYLEIALK